MKRQKYKKTKRQRDKEMDKQRDGVTERQRDRETKTKGPKVTGPTRQIQSKVDKGSIDYNESIFFFSQVD
jgi:hypothetical protein